MKFCFFFLNSVVFDAPHSLYRAGAFFVVATPDSSFLSSLMLIYIVMSERSYDSKTEPKICKIVSVYSILCMTHSCIPFHLKLFMRVGFIPRLNLNIVFSLLFYVKFKILCSF